MKLNLGSLVTVLFLLSFNNSNAQNIYQYKVNLNNVTADELKVELLTPKISTPEIIFHLPKIVPGTYINSDFGKFIHDVKAFNKEGKLLSVSLLPDSNSWKIKNATKLTRLEYYVEDTWDTKIKNSVYEMAGTNFEEKKNFVINTFGLFGYFEGMKKIPFEFEFIKPENFYASSAIVPVRTNETSDVFHCENADLFYDSPIMYCKPDTTLIKIGNTDVLISVYSPKKLVTSKFIAENIKTLLEATKNYLGGKLPVSRYAFLYYFNSEQPAVQGQGALEHSYSSFYSLPEIPEKQFISNIISISSHEFFHIVTPLNMCSKEVREFNFNETILSRHLWLYEGSTEYDAHHTQVTQGMISQEEYLKRLSGKILTSRKFFNDTLSFTQMSMECADKYASQFGNVYNKGALINACLDIYLNKLSNGNYGLRNLKHDLSVKYGATNYFNDNDLFDEITKLTFPEVRSFFSKYVEGNTPIPYEAFFGIVGVKYFPKKDTALLTMGGFATSLSTINEEKVVVVSDVSRMNAFGTKMGYKKDDEIASLNGQKIVGGAFNQVANNLLNTIKEGDMVTMLVNRKNESGDKEKITLSAPAMKVPKTLEHILEFDNTASPEQLKLRRIWLNQKCDN